jgi:hypothetical protein
VTTVEVRRTSSTKAVKSEPVPMPARVSVWLPVVARVNAGVCNWCTPWSAADTGLPPPHPPAPALLATPNW